MKWVVDLSKCHSWLFMIILWWWCSVDIHRMIKEEVSTQLFFCILLALLIHIWSLLRIFGYNNVSLYYQWLFIYLFIYFTHSRVMIRVQLLLNTLLNWLYPIIIHFIETCSDMPSWWSGWRVQITENMRDWQRYGFDRFDITEYRA